MQLPGGVEIAGKLVREAQFTVLTGQLELLLLEQFNLPNHHLDKVTNVLVEALLSIGGEPVDKTLVEHLSVGDRQYLMRQLAGMLNSSPVWVSTQCKSCSETFDVNYSHQALPVKHASSDYPKLSVDSDLGELLVRFPNGNDQKVIASQTDELQSLHCLLQRLVSTHCDNQPIDPAKLSDKDIAKIETLLEAAAPEVATELLTHCPHCEQENIVKIDPYICLQHQPDEVLNELHHIAMHYHWDEDTILNLPRKRRQLYVGLIDRSRGMNNSLQDGAL